MKRDKGYRKKKRLEDREKPEQPPKFGAAHMKGYFTVTAPSALMTAGKSLLDN